MRHELFLASIPCNNADLFADFISDIWDIPCTILPNYLSVTLTPSNQILHTTRLRSLFEDYEIGKIYGRNPLFYGEWDDKSSKLLLACDEELQNMLKIMDRLDLSKPGSQVYYLRDKYAFYQFMKSHQLPVPEVFALLLNGKYYDADMQEIQFEDLSLHRDFFIKDFDGQCASFVKHINNFDDLLKIERINRGGYILQAAVHQSEEMCRINPKSINTLRIVTVKKDGEPHILSAILRVGTEQTGNVDNWAAGGLAIGIDENGRLAKHGFYKPQYGTKTEVHPDTGIIFSNTIIKGFKEACDLCCKAHKYFYNVHSIGWDVALTDDGPVFIEGNDNWEISLMQACNGGLKDKWIEAIR